MPFYEQLLAATETARQEFLQTPVLHAAINGQVSHQAYIVFLSQAYHHVKHTLPLLMACGSRLPLEPRWMREAIADYIEEEKNHEMWILNDIRACGADADAVRYGLPHHSTEMMVAYAYYTIERINPLGFFGMVLVLEGSSTQLACKAAAAIQQNLGLPDAAFSYLNSHGALDIEHMQFYQQLMDKIDNRTDQQAIIHCARRMYKLYGAIFQHVSLSNNGA